MPIIGAPVNKTNNTVSINYIFVFAGFKFGDMVSKILEEDEFGNSFNTAALKSSLHPGAPPFTMDRSPQAPRGPPGGSSDIFPFER